MRAGVCCVRSCVGCCEVRLSAAAASDGWGWFAVCRVRSCGCGLCRPAGTCVVFVPNCGHLCCVLCRAAGTCAVFCAELRALVLSVSRCRLSCCVLWRLCVRVGFCCVRGCGYGLCRPAGTCVVFVPNCGHLCCVLRRAAGACAVFSMPSCGPLCCIVWRMCACRCLSR